MQDRDFYIKAYHSQIEELTEKGELWRICQKSEQKFIEKLDQIFINYANDPFLNDFHRESTTELALELLLQKGMTKEEMVSQAKKHAEATQKYFKRQAPQIKEYAKQLKTPLSKSNLSEIYRWIFRNQIVLNDLPADVKDEFLQSDQHQKLIDRKAL